jgi:metallophosphoesterase superfamily enzyme
MQLLLIRHGHPRPEHVTETSHLHPAIANPLLRRPRGTP